ATPASPWSTASLLRRSTGTASCPDPAGPTKGSCCPTCGTAKFPSTAYNGRPMKPLSKVFVLAAAWLWAVAGVAAPLPDTARARQALAALDAPFEGNVGQYDARV